MPNFIPYAYHAINQDDIEAVAAVLKGDLLTCGPMVEAFEQELGEAVESPFTISCSNGTTALHLAMLGLGITAGDRVIVPAVTFLASANAVRFVGADVIFADVDPQTGLMTAQTLEKAILGVPDPSEIKAVINVHLNGQCEDLEAIHQVAKKYNLRIVEDAAHAIGTSYRDHKGEEHPIGKNAYSDVTTFSLHPAKTIATGEGGAVTCQSPRIAEKMKLLRTHGMNRNQETWEYKDQGMDGKGVPNPWYYEMQDIGFNYRISDINCALGLSQLKKLGAFKGQRQRMVALYDEAFKGHPHITPLKKLPSSDPAWHLYVVLVDFEAVGKSRASVMNALREQGIGTHVHYMPLYRHPYYRNLYGSQSLPGAERYYASCLSLPLYVGLGESDQKRVHKALTALVA